MAKKKKIDEESVELINDSSIETENKLNEPVTESFTKEENLNEVIVMKDPEVKLIQDTPKMPIVTLSTKQRYERMIEGKNFEISASGKAIYSSKSKIKLQLMEDGVMVDRVKYQYSGLTFRIK